jgi:hypothetical protein
MKMVTSVGLLLVGQRGELYVVEELIAKPQYGKKVGDLSFPWETRENGESDEDVLARLVQEEIDRTTDELKQMIEENKPVFGGLPLGTLQMTRPGFFGKFKVYDTEATIYVARYISGPKKLIGSAYDTGEIDIPHDHDTLLINWGWVMPDTLLKLMPIRDGVREIVEAYLKSIRRPEKIQASA